MSCKSIMSCESIYGCSHVGRSTGSDIFLFEESTHKTGVYLETSNRVGTGDEYEKIRQYYLEKGVVFSGALFSISMGSYCDLSSAYKWFITMNKPHPLTGALLNENIKKRIIFEHEMIKFMEDNNLTSVDPMTPSEISSSIFEMLTNYKSIGNLIVDKTFINFEKNAKLYDLDFFHNIDRGTCESIMKQDSCEIGSWMLRPSSVCSQKYMYSEEKLQPVELYIALSVKKTNDTVIHYLLKHEFGVGYHFMKIGFGGFESSSVDPSLVSFLCKLTNIDPSIDLLKVIKK